MKGVKADACVLTVSWSTVAPVKASWPTKEGLSGPVFQYRPHLSGLQQDTGTSVRVRVRVCSERSLPPLNTYLAVLAGGLSGCGGGQGLPRLLIPLLARLPRCLPAGAQ